MQRGRKGKSGIFTAQQGAQQRSRQLSRAGGVRIGILADEIRRVEGQLEEPKGGAALREIAEQPAMLEKRAGGGDIEGVLAIGPEHRAERRALARLAAPAGEAMKGELAIAETDIDALKGQLVAALADRAHQHH